jgi:hypothetical protein
MARACLPFPRTRSFDHEQINDVIITADVIILAAGLTKKSSLLEESVPISPLLLLFSPKQHQQHPSLVR